MSQPPVYPSSRYPDPDPQSYPGYEQPQYPGGQPYYPSHGQPTGQPGYQDTPQPYHPGHGQPPGQPGYQDTRQPYHPSHGQPAGQPGYQGGGPPYYPGHGQPPGQPGYQDTRQPYHSGPGQPTGQPSDGRPPRKSLGSWFGGLSAKGKFRVVLFAIAVLALPFAIYLGLDEPSQADVGDCMTGQSASELRIVACTDSTAQWKVLGRLEGKTEADHNDQACDAYPGTAASFYQDGRRFSKGFILCLGLATK